MTNTIVQQLSAFAVASDYSELPVEVIDECKRIVLDSIGCALAGGDAPKGRIGVQYGRVLGGVSGAATIIGSRDPAGIVGAAFANAELINAIDFDSILPPGHVSPYVLPGALAVAEEIRASGRELISALAVAHELSYRFGRAMDYLRDTKDGKASPPRVTGYSSTIFGATVAIGKLKRFPTDVHANSLGIAASIAPVNALRSWSMHAPSTTVKYMLGGALAQSALTASYMAEFGHRGDARIFDDEEFGYPSFIGTSRWDADGITRDLGDVWRFPSEVSYKPYPVARGLHGLLEALMAVLDDEAIRPHEISRVVAWGEGFLEQPVWLNRDIEHVQDAEFSIAHALALAAHRIPVGREWQNPDVVFSESVLALMDRISFQAHPNYAAAIEAHPASRPTRVEIFARGTSFVGERLYAKGAPSPDASTTFRTDELVTKFRRNADGLLSKTRIASVEEGFLNLEALEDVSDLMAQLRECNPYRGYETDETSITKPRSRSERVIGGV